MDPCGCPQAMPGRQSAGPTVVYHFAEKLTAKDVMEYGVVGVENTESVHRAVSLLLEMGLTGLPVTSRGRLVGAISQRRMLRLVRKQECVSGRVADYMAEEVVTVDVDDPLPTVSTRLARSEFGCVPVLLRQRTLIGTVTRRDLIRVYAERLRPAPLDRHPHNSRPSPENTPGQSLLTLRPDTPLWEAMDLFVQHNVTGLVVVDERMTLLGIITERDLLQHCLHPCSPTRTVGACMTTDVVAFDHKTDLDQICDCMIERDFDQAPMTEQGRLVGLIRRSDILRSRMAAFKP